MFGLSPYPLSAHSSIYRLFTVGVNNIDNKSNTYEGTFEGTRYEGIMKVVYVRSADGASVQNLYHVVMYLACTMVSISIQIINKGTAMVSHLASFLSFILLQPI